MRQEQRATDPENSFVMSINLSDEEPRTLRVAHRGAKNKRTAYRINARQT